MLSSVLVTPGPSGKSRGPTPSLVTSSHRVRTMDKCSYGESKRKVPRRGRGQRSRSTRCTPPQVYPPPTVLSDPLTLYSQLHLLGPPRARCHLGMRLFRRKALRAHIQRFTQRSFYPKPIVNSHITFTFADDGQWTADIFNGHAIGCNAVSWAPAIHPGSLIHPHQPGAPTPPAPFKRFASAGCDNLVKIWSFREGTQAWVEEETLEGHGDWVRDVAWAPNIGLPRSYIATASQVRRRRIRGINGIILVLIGPQDKSVIIWTKDTPTAPWVKTTLDPSPTASQNTPITQGKFPDVVWRVSWSLAGNILAVSCGDGKVTLWKENLKGSWECVSDVNS